MIYIENEWHILVVTVFMSLFTFSLFRGIYIWFKLGRHIYKHHKGSMLGIFEPDSIFPISSDSRYLKELNDPVVYKLYKSYYKAFFISLFAFFCLLGFYVYLRVIG